MRILKTVTLAEAIEMQEKGAKGVFVLKSKMRHDITQVLYAVRQRKWKDSFVFAYQDVIALQPTFEKTTIIVVSPLQFFDFTIPVSNLRRPKECIRSSDDQTGIITNAPKPWCYIE